MNTKQKKVRSIQTSIYFGTRAEMKRAMKRSNEREGHYGFSRYVRRLIEADLKTVTEPT